MEINCAALKPIEHGLALNHDIKKRDLSTVSLRGGCRLVTRRLEQVVVFCMVSNDNNHQAIARLTKREACKRILSINLTTKKFAKPT